MTDAILPSPDNSGYTGERELGSGSSEFNAHHFLIQQLIGKISTATLVQIVAVTNSGGVDAVGFVDVHPLVNQIDGLKNATPHGTIFNVPYFRIQGGANAVILDPEVGDIGLAIFADHDISTVKVTKKDANPGSFRRFDMADGLYIGGFLNAVPTQFVRFHSGGVDIKTPLLTVEGDLQVTGAVIAGFGGGDQVGLQTHTHSQSPDSHGDDEEDTNAPTPE